MVDQIVAREQTSRNRILKATTSLDACPLGEMANARHRVAYIKENTMFSIIMITSYLITAPLITLLHELGHAIPILIFTKNSIEIELGTERGQTKEIVIGRIKFNYKSYSLFTGFCKYSGSTKK